MGGNMRNTLFWIALAALSLQDLFKKQSPTKRQQQFFQTGGTAQAFIEGFGYSAFKKEFIKYFGQPDFEVKRDNSRWNYKFGNNDVTIILMRNYNKNYIDIIITPKSLYLVDKNFEEYLFKPYFLSVSKSESFLKDTAQVFIPNFFTIMYISSNDDSYEKLKDIAYQDPILALELAKGQELI